MGASHRNGPTAVVVALFAVSLVTEPLVSAVAATFADFMTLGFAPWVLRADRIAPGDAVYQSLTVWLFALLLIPFALLGCALTQPDCSPCMGLRIPRLCWQGWATLLAVPLAVDASLDAVQALARARVSIPFEYTPERSPGGAIEILGMAVIAPFAEELFYRGVMQPALINRWGRWRGILVASAAFGLAHMDPARGVASFIAGVALGWAVDRSGTLLPALVAHALNNLGNALLGTSVEGVPLAGQVTVLFLSAGSLACTLRASRSVLPPAVAQSS